MKWTLAIGALAIAAATFSVPAQSFADAELVMLMRGMAVIKALLLLGALAVLWWRFGQPYSRGVALAYSSGLWMAVAATVMIWQLVQIPAAAVLFHAGELIMLVTAWRDDGLTMEALRRQPVSEPVEAKASAPQAPADLADAA